MSLGMETLLRVVPEEACKSREQVVQPAWEVAPLKVVVVHRQAMLAASVAKLAVKAALQHRLVVLRALPPLRREIKHEQCCLECWRVVICEDLLSSEWA